MAITCLLDTLIGYLLDLEFLNMPVDHLLLEF